MTDDKDPSRDIRIQNVSLHSRGKTENGALLLTRHHLIFSYHPSGAKAGEDSASINPRNANSHSSTTPKASGADEHHEVRENSSNSALAQQTALGVQSKAQHDAGTTAPPKRTKARPKEVWVPYPMINHCVLRFGGHAQRQSFRPGEWDRAEAGSSTADAADDDHAFPPTYGTSAYTRPSTDSGHLPTHLVPSRSQSPATGSSAHVLPDSGRAPAIRIRRRDFQMMAFHFNGASSEQSVDDVAKEVFLVLRNRCCAENLQSMHAFTFKPPQEEMIAGDPIYDAKREFARMGIGGKAAEGPGSAWRLSEINREYAFSPTYPSVLCVPRTVTDNILKYGGAFRSRARIPVLTYLHSNGGTITRSSQPMVGIQNRRNPQDEKLVSAIFSSHTPFSRGLEDIEPGASSIASRSSSTLAVDERDLIYAENGSADPPASVSDTALDEQAYEHADVPQKKVYGSTRRTIIVDARPRINALANRASGGGIEDTSNYVGTAGTPVEKCFLDIANIHVMRASLEKVVDSFGSSDYLDLRPNQDLLRKSGWLPHIANLLSGAEEVARAVGLGASHVLVHCSDGWDRTAQVAAIAQIMMDPHYRTLAGFITLVQKDFFSFGHKFNHRHGIQGSEKWFEIENERTAPTKSRESGMQEANSFNALGSKALSGARNWFEKGRGTLFRQPGGEGADTTPSNGLSSTSPANPIIHSTPSASVKEEKEHKVDVKEIAPIFHQFLEAVFQLQHQDPDSFEYNERFLRRLHYQAFSSQYGEFLFNTERERLRYTSETHSVWAHFLSRRQEFVNSNYIPKTDDPLFFPKRNLYTKQVEVCWWAALFGRKDEEMNTPVSLDLPDTTATARLSMQSATETASAEERTTSTEQSPAEFLPPANGHTEARGGLLGLSSLRHNLPTAVSSLRYSSDLPKNPAQDVDSVSGHRISPDARYSHARNAKAAIPSLQTMKRDSTASTLVEEVDDGRKDLFDRGENPKVSNAASSKLDFAEFARQSAFNER